MKRVGLILASLCMIVLLSGCGSSSNEKKLECTYTQENAKQVYTINFDKKEKFVSAVLKQDATLTSEQLETHSLEEYKKQIEDNWQQTDYSDLDSKVTDDGVDTITLTVNFDADDMEKLTGSSTSSNDLEEVKESLEKGGYTCNIVE